MLHIPLKPKTGKLCLLTVLLLLIHIDASYISMTVSASDLEINKVASYKFILNRQFDPVNNNFISSPTPVPLNSKIAIVFPSQFLTISSTTAVTCTNSNGDDLGCVLTSASRTVTISNYYSTSATLSDSLITITMPLIVNAYIAGACGNFFWQIVNSNGSIIDQGPPAASNYLSTSLTFVGGSFQVCKISVSGAYVSQFASFTFQLTPSNQIPSNGKIVISIPNSWASDPLSDSTFQNSPTCAEISGIGSSSLSCSYSSSLQQLTVTGITNSISSAFSFSVSSILTPPTVGSGESISIYSQWQDGTEIDSCSALVAGLVAAPFQAISLASNDNTTVQSSFTGRLQLTLSRTFYYQDTIVFILPDDFLSVSVSSINFATMTKIFNLNKLTLSNFPNPPSSIASNNVITFTLSAITNPISTAPITLNVTFYRNNQLYQTSLATYSSTLGQISTFSITPDSNFVQVIGQTTLTLVSSLYFPTGSTIMITYPSTVTASDSAISSVTRCSLNGTLKSGVTYSVSFNQIKFSGVFSSNFKGTVVLVIPNFYNPLTIQPSDYALSVVDSSSYPVVSGSFTLTASTKSLISNSVSASSLTVLATGVTYKVSITTNYEFTAISIIVPSQITVGSSYQTTCAPNSFSSCVLSSNNLTYIGTLNAGSYQLSWGYNTNPNSLEPTASFQITTYRQGWAVEKSIGVISITMANPASFKTFVIYPSAYNNSATISVTLAITVSSGAPGGELTTTFPSELGLSSASCSGCTVVPPSIIIPFSIGTTNTTLTVNNVQNIASFKPISSFTASLKNSNSYSSMSSTAAGWTNTEPSSFTTTVTGNNNYKGESNTFLFSLQGLSGAQSYVRVTIGSAFPAVTTAPAGATRVDDHNLDYACTGSLCSISLPLKNPTTSGTFYFLLATYTSDNYKVGTSTSNSWTYDCAGTNCKSCDSSGSCTSCYSSSISVYSIFSVSGSTCISACPTGFFLINTTCTPCDSNCSECTTTSTHCTSCPSNFYLDTVYFLCIQTCLTGYFQNSMNKQCDACTLPCVTCTSTSETCLSCSSTTYLFVTSCLPNCPTGSHIANPTTNKCDACDSNCLTCSLTTTHCLTCNNTANLFFQGYKCVSSCSTNYFLVDNICTYCQSPCKTCSSSIHTCSSCFLNETYFIYYSFTCITSAQCPVGHYVNTTNSSCEQCPTVCTQCSSYTSCSVCATNYYLYGSTCMNICPNTTYNYTNTTSGYCLTCTGCQTCSGVSICTSCPVGQYLYLSACYSVCPNGTYSSGSICTICPTDCPTCRNDTYCLTCVNNMYLYLGICYANCPNNTYSNGLLCSVCPSSCTTCTSLTSCQTCSSSYSLEYSQCVLTCSIGISYNQLCYPCGLHCAICSNSTGICSLCDSTYLLYNNTCVTSCPSNMLTQDNQNCVLCSSAFVNCSTCTNTQCLSCTYGQLVNGSCKPCNPGFYEQSGACIVCPSACLTCTSQTVCQTCSANHYMYDSVCTSQCPRNMVPNGTICSFCASQCSVCNLVTSLCTTCNAGVYLYNNSCYGSCPSPLVVSYDFLTCVTEQVYYQQFSSSAKIIPFPFTIATAVLIAIGYILKCFHQKMHLQTALCAIVSLIELGAWIIFLAFELRYWVNYHSTAMMGFICSCVAVVILCFLNFLHLKFFYKYASPDDEFLRWYKNNGCANCVIISLATSLTFKFYRLVHSKFLGRNELSMVLSSINKLVPFSLLGILSIILCSIPICVGCSLGLYNSVSKDQQFYIALDTLVVTAIMVILILMDLRHSDDYFHDEYEAKNLKRKIYEEDSIKFQKLHGEGSESHSSEGKVGHVQEDEGQNAAASTGQKFKSTFMHTKRLEEEPASMAKIQAEEYQEGAEEQEFRYQQSQGDQAMAPTSAMQKGKWQPVKFDHFGYQIKYDANNNQIRYDQNGYRVEIDENGNHKKFNQKGQEVRIINGKHCVFDENGYLLIDGKPHDERGYQVRQEDGKQVFYDEHGFRVIGEPPDEKHIDENGYIVKVDQNGEIKRYHQDGYQVVDYKGKKVFKSNEGAFVRKNEQGQWQMYDPEDGFILKVNPQTGKIQKYDEKGFRIEIDKFGNLRRYDEDGFIVTVLPGGVVVRHDNQGYRVQKDAEGKIHRFDEDGYEFVTDQQGRPKFIDQHGYRVQRDLYGRVTLYDEEGLRVVIDPQTGKHHRYNQEGLEAITDSDGNKILKDKRGKIVKEINQETFQKYDNQGNKIYLDDNGYEVEYDEQGNIVLYDKVGDRVQTEYDITESDVGDNFESVLVHPHKKPLKYKYQPTKEIDNQAELQRLMRINQPFTFQEQSQISELKDIHDYVFPAANGQVEGQLEEMVNQQREQLVVKEEHQEKLEKLGEKDFHEELDELDEQKGEGLEDIHEQYRGSKMLEDREGGLQSEYDRQALARGLDEKDPDVLRLKRKQDIAAAKARKKDLNRILNAPRQQEPVEIKSVADVELDQRSFNNQGVQPLQNRTEFDSIGEMDELELPLGKGKRGKGNRSEAYLQNGKKATNTVYNYNTVQVEIKKQNKLYDEQQQIQSLHEEEWQEQEPVFARERVKEGTSNANTNIIYLQENEDNKDALSDLIQHQSETKTKLKPLNRYPLHNQILSGRSIEEIEEQLFGQINEYPAIRERKEFKLSGDPNPLVEYAKAMEANRKSIQEKMYLDNVYKR